MTATIEVGDLVKRYGDTAAVAGVSFHVAAGEVYGLLGENGAGKSTTVEILEGHRRRSSGSVAVLGVDPVVGGRAWRDRIGVVLQSSGFESALSVGELLTLYRSSYRNPRPVDECLALVGLSEAAGKRARTLSGGQLRRLDLAAGIIGRPEVLFLDEPTTGFDPAARRSSWELVRSLCADGTTVLLTSHYLDEVEHLADRVGVLVRGRMVAEGTPADLIGTIGTTKVRFTLGSSVPDGDGASSDGAAGVVDARSELAALLGGAGQTPTVEPDGFVTVLVANPTRDVHRLTSWALDRGIELHGLTVTRPSLEDLFLDIVSGEAP